MLNKLYTIINVHFDCIKLYKNVNKQNIQLNKIIKHENYKLLDFSIRTYFLKIFTGSSKKTFRDLDKKNSG